MFTFSDGSVGDLVVGSSVGFGTSVGSVGTGVIGDTEDEGTATSVGFVGTGVIGDTEDEGTATSVGFVCFVGSVGAGVIWDTEDEGTATTDALLGKTALTTVVALLNIVAADEEI